MNVARFPGRTGPVGHCRTATLAGEQIAFQKGEALITEQCHKPSESEFADLAQDAGLSIGGSWVDESWKYGLYWLETPSFKS